MYYINKIVYFFCNPVMIGLLPFLAGLIFAHRAWRRTATSLLAFSFCWLWFCCTITPTVLLGLPLERRYLGMQKAEDSPQADAIVLLGGGMIAAEGRIVYPDMCDGADRVWHAARLWKAGKAPIIICSGIDELTSSVPLLKDFGIPDSAIKVDNESRNTFENARFTERLLSERSGNTNVLLVTSAWHLPRAVGNFSKTKLNVIPAPADFTCSLAVEKTHWYSFFVPQPGNLELTCMVFKEWLGRLARK